MAQRFGTVSGRPTAITSLRVICRQHAVHRVSPWTRHISSSSSVAATPVAHPTIPGAPPPPPQQSVTYAGDRIERRKAQAVSLGRAQSKNATPVKPGSSPLKRFWKDVSVQELEGGLQIHLDKRAVRTGEKRLLTLPYEKRMLAGAIALEWEQLVSAQQALKHHYIPLTSLVSRALDIQAADAAENTTIREGLIKILLRYLSTDTLLCWEPGVNMHDPELKPGQKSLRDRQREVAAPIIAYLRSHVFPGVEFEPILDESSIIPKPQSELTVEVVRGWMHGLPAFELAALERGVLATKSLLVAVRLLVEWSGEFKELAKPDNGARFGIEDAAYACNLEVLHQIEQWKEVEDTHDVDAADLRRQLGSVILLVS